MIEKILVVARREVQAWIDHDFYHLPPEGPWSLISIWNDLALMTFPNIAKVTERGCNDTLSLEFADLTHEYEDMKLFNEHHAERIIAFIDKVNKTDTKTLVVHCAAGICRSGATGLFACRYLKLDETEFRKENPYISPNMLVLQTLNNVSGMNSDYTDFWQKRFDSWIVDKGEIF